MTRSKWFVGRTVANSEVFKSETIPTWSTHGSTYNAVIGPFRTKRGATFMARYGNGNPHCCTVDEAENLARAYKGELAL